MTVEKQVLAECVASSIDEHVASHSIWKSDLLKSLKAGSYSRESLAFVFEQHYHYSRSFTKLLCLAASRMDDSEHRATIVENLYEEAGEENIDERHSELMKIFLMKIGVDVSGLKIQPFTRLYVDKCLSYLAHCDAVSAAAFLAWGTEGIVPDLYEIFVSSLRAVGMPENDFRYFSLHIECDDGHHEALADIALSHYYAATDDQRKEFVYAKIIEAIDVALNLRAEYFTQIFQALSKQTLDALTDSISLQPILDEALFQSLSHSPQDSLDTLYHNQDEGNVDFVVERSSLRPEVIDPRILTVAPKSRNESHRHAHESFFYILSGEGRTFIGSKVVDLTPGAMVYVPRWVDHHSENTGDTPLKVLAITDFGLTRRFGSNSEASYRKVSDNVGHAAIA